MSDAAEPRGTEEGTSAETRACPADTHVAQHLTALAVPAETTSTDHLPLEIVNSSPEGVMWKAVRAEVGQVNIRAGLLPGLDAEALRMISAKMPGVASATVEGCGVVEVARNGVEDRK